MDREAIINRLKTLGYEYDYSDDYAIEFATTKIAQQILNNINCSEIPKGLTNIAVDMVCAEFLKVKKGFGLLDNAKFEQIAQTIKLGDTNIQFANESTPEQKFDTAINYLLNGHNDDFTRYRKLVW